MVPSDETSRLRENSKHDSKSELYGTEKATGSIIVIRHCYYYSSFSYYDDDALSEKSEDERKWFVCL